jgi:hypothetical protein
LLPFPFPNMAGALTPTATRPSGGSQGIIYISQGIIVHYSPSSTNLQRNLSLVIRPANLTSIIHR